MTLHVVVNSGKVNSTFALLFVSYELLPQVFQILFTGLELIFVMLFLSSFEAINEWLAPLSSSAVRVLPSILIVMTSVHCQSLNLFFEFNPAATRLILGTLCLRVIFLLLIFYI